MQVKSPAILYTDTYLRQLREKIHFARIPKQYKFMIRNMIKLLALHGIYKEVDKNDPDWRQLVGDYINEKRKTKGALSESTRRGRIVQANVDRRYRDQPTTATSRSSQQTFSTGRLRFNAWDEVTNYNTSESTDVIQ